MAEFISAHRFGRNDRTDAFWANGNVILEQDGEIAAGDSDITYTVQDLGNDTYVSDYGWGLV